MGRSFRARRRNAVALGANAMTNSELKSLAIDLLCLAIAAIVFAELLPFLAP